MALIAHIFGPAPRAPTVVEMSVDIKEKWSLVGFSAVENTYRTYRTNRSQIIFC
jgi:hypothetical protein